MWCVQPLPPSSTVPSTQIMGPPRQPSSEVCHIPPLRQVTRPGASRSSMPARRRPPTGTGPRESLHFNNPCTPVHLTPIGSFVTMQNICSGFPPPPLQCSLSVRRRVPWRPCLLCLPLLGTRIAVARLHRPYPAQRGWRHPFRFLAPGLAGAKRKPIRGRCPRSGQRGPASGPRPARKTNAHFIHF